MCMTYHAGYSYYFWNIEGNYVDSVFVLKCNDGILTFEYRGKTMRCSLSYAEGKLFDWPHQALPPWNTYDDMRELDSHESEYLHDAGYSVWPDDYDDA